MKNLVFLFSLLFCSTLFADPSISDQLNALDSAQNQALINQQARQQEEYRARMAEQQRMERIAAQQHETERVLQEKAMQQRAEEKKAAEARAKIEEDKANARIKAQNDERLQDKFRQQTQEDEEREFVKQQSALKLQEAELEIQRLKAKAELEIAIAKDRIKSVDVDTSIARKKETTEIDVVQSGADVDRTLANGLASGFSGLGNDDLYKFLVIFSLIVLALLAAFIFWRFSLRPKLDKSDNSSRFLTNSDEGDKNL